MVREQGRTHPRRYTARRDAQGSAEHSGLPGKWQIFNAEFKTIEREAKSLPDNATEKNRFPFEEPKVIEKFLLDELKKAGL